MPSQTSIPDPNAGGGGGGFTPTAWAFESTRFAAAGSGNSNTTEAAYDTKKEYVFGALAVGWGVIGALTLTEVYSEGTGWSGGAATLTPQLFYNDATNGDDILVDEAIMFIPSGMLSGSTATQVATLTVAIPVGGSIIMRLKPPMGFDANYTTSGATSVQFILASRQMVA